MQPPGNENRQQSASLTVQEPGPEYSCRVTNGVGIHRMPRDVLQEIFSYGILQDPTVYRWIFTTKECMAYIEGFQPQIIASVCRSWRSIALSTSTLWARFSIWMSISSMHDFYCVQKFVARALERSQIAKLRCELGLRFGEETGFAVSPSQKSYLRDSVFHLFESLFKHQGRWVRVTLECDLDDLIPRAMHHLHVDRLKYLKELGIDTAYRIEVHAKDIMNTAHCLPYLEGLAMHGDAKVEELVLLDNCLETLQIESAMSHIPSRTSQLSSYQRQLRPIVTKKTIRDLTLDASVTTRECSDYLLKTMTCPSLAYVTFKDFTESSVTLATKFLLRSSPPLLDVFFDTVEKISMEFLIPFLRSIHTAKTLSLGCFEDDSSPTLFALARLSNSNFDLLPHLESIELMSTRVSRDAVTEFASARRTGPNTVLRTITLVDCYHPEARTRNLPTYLGEDIKLLPRYWRTMENLIVDGLNFKHTLS